MYIKPLMPTGIPTNVPLMPQYFQQAGYTTHGIGKWHLGFCHQNYTPTYRGFDSFYGFYLGSQDYYLHSKYYQYESQKQLTSGYDFRFNEAILQGPEVRGKYSADLFVQRARNIFQGVQQQKKAGSQTKPWFTYLSFQSVHDPLQVPHSYKQNVCKYRDLSRYFYSAMVSSLDHAVDQVVKSLKETGQYENTVIVFTTDNGGAVKVGGSNLPLRGTKGTLYEGGTRAIGFIHSPLLKKSGYTSSSLMHAVDWLPTLMSAIGQKGLAVSATDGIDQWSHLSSRTSSQPREEVVYNIKEKPFMAAIRVGNYKLIWGSRTEKNKWFPAMEQVENEVLCNITLSTRSKSVQSLEQTPRDMLTMDVLNLGIDPDRDYWEEEDQLAALQELDMELEQEEGSLVEGKEVIEDMEGRSERVKRGANKNKRRKWRQQRAYWRRKGRQGGKKGWKKNKGNKKGNKGGGGGGGKKNKNRKKNFIIPNNHGVKIRSWGKSQVFDLVSDPNEKVDLAGSRPDLVKMLQHRAMEHYLHLRPRDVPPESVLGDPVRWGGYYGPGWCHPRTVTLD